MAMALVCAQVHVCVLGTGKTKNKERRNTRNYPPPPHDGMGNGRCVTQSTQQQSSARCDDEDPCRLIGYNQLFVTKTNGKATEVYVHCNWWPWSELHKTRMKLVNNIILNNFFIVFFKFCCTPVAAYF